MEFKKVLILLTISLSSFSVVIGGPTSTCYVDPDHHHVIQNFAKHIVSKFSLREHEQNFRKHKRRIDECVGFLRQLAEHELATNINVDTIERMETNVIQASGMMAKVEDDLKILGRNVGTSTGTLLRHLQIFKGQHENARRSTYRNIMELVNQLANESHEALKKEVGHIDRARVILTGVSASIVVIESQLTRASTNANNALNTALVTGFFGIISSLTDGEGDGGWGDVSGAIEESGVAERAAYSLIVTAISDTLRDGFNFFNEELETVTNEERDVDSWKDTLNCIDMHGEEDFVALSDVAEDDGDWSVLLYDVQQANTYANSFQ